MSRQDHPLQYVDAMIDYLEKKIQSNALSPQILHAMQQRLDKLSAAYAQDPAFGRYYPHMLELQTLIFGESGQEAKALVYLKEAVRETGAVSRLRSQLLKQYIADHSSQPKMRQPAVALGSRLPAANYTTRRERAPLARKLKLGFATGFAIAAICFLTLHFVPRAAAFPIMLARHSQIAQVQAQYAKLTAEYKTCSSDLASRQGSINPNDLVGVDSYNNDVKQCDALLQQLQNTEAKFNSLTVIGHIKL